VNIDANSGEALGYKPPEQFKKLLQSFSDCFYTYWIEFMMQSKILIVLIVLLSVVTFCSNANILVILHIIYILTISIYVLFGISNT